MSAELGQKLHARKWEIPERRVFVTGRTVLVSASLSPLNLPPTDLAIVLSGYGPCSLIHTSTCIITSPAYEFLVCSLFGHAMGLPSGASLEISAQGE